MVQTIGIDLGSQKTMIVADDADIVLTDTGSISRPTLVSFFGKSRLVGEEAAPQVSGDYTVPMINTLLGKRFPDVESSTFNPHRKAAIKGDNQGRLYVDVNYCDETKSILITPLLGMFLAKTAARINDVYGSEMKLSFALPPNYSPSVSRAIKEACRVANIDLNRITTMDSTDCLVATYARKLQGLRGPEKANLEVNTYVVLSYPLFSFTST